MATDTEKTRASVEDLLKGNKTLTEREVKSAVGKNLHVNPRDVRASLIRDVRRSLGIDRPAALAFARGMLAKEPGIEARKVMDAVSERFGIRLGPPDVSRLRPDTRAARASRSNRGRKPRNPPPPRSPRPAGPALRKGTIQVTFQGAGAPSDLATFFLELGRKKTGNGKVGK